MQLSDSMQLTKVVFLLVFSTFKAQKHLYFVNKIQIRFYVFSFEKEDSKHLTYL